MAGESVKEYSGELTKEAIWDWVKKLVKDGLTKEEVIAAGDKAIEALVAYDIPRMPNWMEVWFDQIMEAFLKAQLRSFVEGLYA